MPVISLTVSISPPTGISRCRVISCSPWTSIAGLNEPIWPNAPPPPPRTTAIVGSTFWSMPVEFSVVYCSSSSGTWPAPTPTA